jgi:hypothetical protein
MRKVFLSAVGVLALVGVAAPALAADMAVKVRAAPVVTEQYASGPARYYYDGYYYYWAPGYGPYYDCNGSRCYGDRIGYRYGGGQFYYGPTGGYYHPSSW